MEIHLCIRLETRSGSFRRLVTPRTPEPLTRRPLGAPDVAGETERKGDTGRCLFTFSLCDRPRLHVLPRRFPKSLSCDTDTTHCFVLFCFAGTCHVTFHAGTGHTWVPLPRPPQPCLPRCWAGRARCSVWQRGAQARPVYDQEQGIPMLTRQRPPSNLGGQVLRPGKLRVLRRPPAGLRHMGQGHGEPTGPLGSTPPQGLQGAHDQASPQASYSGQVLFPPSLTLPCPRAKTPGTSFSLAPDTRLVHPHDISFKQPESTAPTHAYCPPSLWRCLNGRRSSQPLTSLGQMGGERNAGQDEQSPVTKEQHTRPLPTAAERSRRR